MSRPLVLVFVLAPVLALPASAQEARADYELDGRVLTHHGFGFSVAVPDGWSMVAGPDAAGRIAGASAVFERADDRARGFLEVMWNASIDAPKFMEQLVETYADGQRRVRGGAARAGALRGVQSLHAWRTPDGTPAATLLVSVGRGEWKFGFGFSCPEGDLASARPQFDAILASLEVRDPRRPEAWQDRHAFDDPGVAVVLPDPLWRIAGPFWAPEADDEGTFTFVSRDPYAAYGLFGSRPAAGTTPDREIARLLAHVAARNGSTRPARKSKKQVVVDGARGVRHVYRNTASFPHQDYWITIVGKGDRLYWSVLWALPDNAGALAAEFETLSTGWAFTTD